MIYISEHPTISCYVGLHFQEYSDLVTCALLLFWSCQSELECIHKCQEPLQKDFKNYQHIVVHLDCKQLFSRDKWKISFVSNYDGKELKQLESPWLLFVCSNCVHCCLARNLITDTVTTSIASTLLLEMVKFKSSHLSTDNTKASMVLLDSARRRLFLFCETDIIAKNKKIFYGVLWSNII